ncbi:hypothetical protein BD413DRAFT_62335 [Trametes elegans]|nr:hypothetical protein BD413DRAFT_62335 [Trametes elegans]
MLQSLASALALRQHAPHSTVIVQNDISHTPRTPPSTTAVLASACCSLFACMFALPCAPPPRSPCLGARVVHPWRSHPSRRAPSATVFAINLPRLERSCRKPRRIRTSSAVVTNSPIASVGVGVRSPSSSWVSSENMNMIDPNSIYAHRWRKTLERKNMSFQPLSPHGVVQSPCFASLTLRGVCEAISSRHYPISHAVYSESRSPGQAASSPMVRRFVRHRRAVLRCACASHSSRHTGSGRAAKWTPVAQTTE